MNEPIKWEKVPVEGTDLGQEVYRSLVDGQGWIVTTVAKGSGRFISSFFVPDPNGKWGQEPEKVERKDRWA